MMVININLLLISVVGIKAQNNMLGLGLLSEDAEWSEGQIVIRGSQLKFHK